MRPARQAAAAVVLAGAIAAAGCGLGSGPQSEGEVTLTVTRDYGAEVMVDEVLENPPASDTVMRALDREAEITTRYGGGFVQSIEGVAGGVEDGRSVDWFFYVNGIESPIGSAEFELSPGDRIWWDHHDWTDVMRVPAVVGAFPQPFLAAGEEPGAAPIEIGCATGAGEECEAVAAALEHEGADAEVVDFAAAEAGERPRVLVGDLDALADDPVGALLADGPDRSGVFARPAPGEEGIELLDERVEVERTGAFGLVAATIAAEEAPTWIVTATEPDLLAGAAELVGGGLLRNRFALAIDGDGETIPVPVR